MINVKSEKMGKFSVQIRLPMSEANIETAYKALESETEFKKKADITIKKDKRALIVDISSNDVSSLHAATGSILRAIKIITSVANAPGKSSKE